MKTKTRKANGKKGFTLIELIVAVSVFTMVMVLSTGSILTMLDSNRKSQNLRSVMDNLNQTLESMTRTIRFGENYHCGSIGTLTRPRDCSSGDPTLVVRDSGGNLVSYTLTGGQIRRSVNGGTSLPMTSSDVVIQSLMFRVVGSYPYTDPLGGTTDLMQPRVIITVGGYVGGKVSVRSSFSLETTISQRKLDFQ